LVSLFVTPGLIDCHVHPQRSSYGRERIERYPLTRVLRAVGDAQRLLAAGFLTVRHLGHGAPRTPKLSAMRQPPVPSWVRAFSRAVWAISQTGGHGNVPAWHTTFVDHLRPRSTFADGPDELPATGAQNHRRRARLHQDLRTEACSRTPEALRDPPELTPLSSRR